MLRCRRSCRRGWRRNCRGCGHLPVSRYAGGRHRNRGCIARGIAASIFAAMAPVGEASSLPGLAQSFFRPASSELLLTGTGSLSGPAMSGVAGLTILDATVVLPISLAALAALALPGAGALTILNTASGAPHKMGWPATPFAGSHGRRNTLD